MDGDDRRDRRLGAAVGGALAGHTRGGEWGAIIVSLTRGDTLFAQNADAMMQPASTMKMYTSAVALDRFGPDYTFRTPALRDGTVGPDGTLTGNLYLRGSGDPSLSSRFWHDAQPMDELAKEIAQAGVKQVHGDIVGDAERVRRQARSRTVGRRATSAPRTPRACRRSRSTRISSGLSSSRTAARPQVTLEPATTTIPVENDVTLSGGSGGRISACAPRRRNDRRARIDRPQFAGRSSIRSSSTTRRCSRPARCAPRCRSRASPSTVRRASAPRRRAAVEVAAISSPPLAQIVGEMDRESINIVRRAAVPRDGARGAQSGRVGRDGTHAPARLHVDEGRNASRRS